jgi:hypothetical protein
MLEDTMDPSPGICQISRGGWQLTRTNGEAAWNKEDVW